MPTPPPPDFASLSLADIARLAEENRLPPVESWHPEHCGDSDMRIARDGTWYHQGSPIGRAAMIRLFSTILRREADGSFVLVTPVEKLSIAVEDAPFQAVEMKAEGVGAAMKLGFRLNTGDLVTAGPGHRLRFEDGPRPYLHVRAGLEALVARSVYYELAEIALGNGSEPPGVWSDGAFFSAGAGMTLAERLRVALETAHEPILLTGDHHDFDPGEVTHPAAVLVAVTDRADPGVILTQRTETLRRHAGQVAFPGGRIDPEDDGPVAAALREAEEEIALPRARVQVIGTADRYRTVTGYCVTPVIGVVAPDLAYVPAEAEVADVFEVPLSFLFDDANHREASVEYLGRQRRYYEIDWHGRRIWGATAAMIVNLSRRLRWTA